MPNQESAFRFIFSLIWPSAPPEPHKHTLVTRLGELRATRQDFLTEDEYADIRATFLAELTTHPRMPLIQLLMFVLFCVSGLAIIIYFLLDRAPSSAGVGAVVLIVSGSMWWRMECDFAAKRRLTRADRLTAVDDLVMAELVSAEEAATLRIQIESFFDNERAA
jgi:hypothetical protein